MEHNTLILHNNVTGWFERREEIAGAWKLQEGVVNYSYFMRLSNAPERRNCPTDRVPEERGTGGDCCTEPCL